MARVNEAHGSPVHRSSLDHRERSWSPTADRWVFFGFFLAGGLSILTLKGLVDSQMVVTGLPCVLMLIYTSMLCRQQPRSDAAGDNLYYLGFLYTLTSLAHSLYHFNAGETNAEVIVTNFGIAISTTILGMALRVFIGRPSVEESSVLDASARLDLAEETRRLRREMGYAIATFRESLEQELGSIRERVVQDAENIHEINTRAFERMQSLGHSIAGLDEAMKKAAASLVTRAQELERSTNAWTALEDSIHRLDSHTKEQVEAIVQRSAALTAGVEEVREALVAQARQLRAIEFRDALLSAVKPASTELRAAATELGTLLDTLRRTGTERDQALASIERVSAKLQETLSGQHDLANAVLDALSDSRKAASSLRVVSEQLVRSIDGAKDVAHRISSVRDRLADSATQLGSVNESLTNASAALRFWTLKTDRDTARHGWFRWLRRPRG